MSEKRNAERKAPIRVYMQRIELACKQGKLGKAIDGRMALENDLLYGRRDNAEHTFYETLKAVRCVKRAVRIIRKYFPDYIDIGMSVNYIDPES